MKRLFLLAAACLLSVTAQAQSVYPYTNRAGTGPAGPGDPLKLSERKAADAAKQDINGDISGQHVTSGGASYPVPSWLSASRAPDKNVFIGGVGPNFCAGMGNAAGVSQMLALGNIGVYEHANGISVCTPAKRSTIWNTWAPTGINSNGMGQMVGEVGGFSPIPPVYTGYFGGSYPNEVNMNILTNSGDGTGSYTAGSGDASPGTVYTGYTSASDLATMETAINAAIGAGARNVAIFMSPNGGGEDLVDPFATAPYWANVRAAALYGGGIALDVPPNYFLQRTAPYQAMIAQMVKWAVAQGLRVSLTVSPYAVAADSAGNTGGCGYDPTMLEATMQLVAYLKAAGAMPTQWIVEAYGLVSTTPPCGTENDIATDATAESLNAVALYLARTTVTALPGTVPPGAPGGSADSGQQSSTTPLPRVATSLSNARVGPLRLADIAGAGTMAAQDSSDVQITGGVVNNVAIQTTKIPLFLHGEVIQGSGGVIVLQAEGSANTLYLATPGGLTALNLSGDLYAASIGSGLSGRIPTIAAVNVDMSGAVGISGALFQITSALPTAYNPTYPNAVWSKNGAMTVGNH